MVTACCTSHSDAGEQTFQRKEACQNIPALSCDLTADTPSVHDVHYSARVFVNGRLHGKTDTRFTPIAHSKNPHSRFFPARRAPLAEVLILLCLLATLGPPILSTRTTVSSLHVNVTLPRGPGGVSVADIIATSKNRPIRNVIVYVLRITHPEWAAQVRPIYFIIYGVQQVKNCIEKAVNREDKSFNTKTHNIGFKDGSGIVWLSLTLSSAFRLWILT